MGKGTLFVPAAHGGLLDPPTLKGSNVRPYRAEVLMHPQALNTSTFDPFRVGVGATPWSVGGGHQNRALAHGYSMHTPAGFKDRFWPDFRTARVQPKMRDMLSPRRGIRIKNRSPLHWGEGGPQGGG